MCSPQSSNNTYLYFQNMSKVEKTSATSTLVGLTTDMSSNEEIPAASIENPVVQNYGEISELNQLANRKRKLPVNKRYNKALKATDGAAPAVVESGDSDIPVEESITDVPTTDSRPMVAEDINAMDSGMHVDLQQHEHEHALRHEYQLQHQHELQHQLLDEPHLGHDLMERKRIHLDWNLHYAALLKYREEHGHCNIPYIEKYECDLPGMGEDGGTFHYFGTLGSWLTRQRRFRRGIRGTLPPERESLLQVLVDEGALLWDNSEMSATVRMKRHGDLEWPRHYAALLEYFKEYGHCNVHKRFKHENYRCTLHGFNEDGTDSEYAGKLGTWLANQRSFHKGRRGEQRKLPPDRESLLQRLVDEGKLLWDASDLGGTRLIGAVTWPKHYAALLEFRKQHGHCNVPQGHVFECDLVGHAEDGSTLHYSGNLGRWLMTQRQCKRGQRTGILPAREALLQRLVDEGVLTWEPAGGELTKKNSKGKDKTEEENRQSAINRARMSWGRIGDPDWAQNYAALLKYCEEFGDCNVPQKCIYECVLTGMGPDGTDLLYKGNLGQWLRAQRQTRRVRSAIIGPLSDVQGPDGEMNTPLLTLSEREVLLQRLVDEGKLLWDATEKRGNKASGREWNRHFAALLKYGEEHGHCNIPQAQSYECVLEGMGDDGGDYHYSCRLGTWLCTQRQQRKKIPTQLRPEREAMLQRLVDEGRLLWDVHHMSTVLQCKQQGDNDWPIYFAALEKFCREHGDARQLNVSPTAQHEADLGPAEDGGDSVHFTGKLGFWLFKQRTARRLGKLTAEREALIQRLVDEGLVTWEAPDPRREKSNDSWSKHYAALVEYGKEHGTCNAPLKTTFTCVLQGMGEGGTDLEYEGNIGFWLNRQRQARKHMNGHKRLTADREALLQQLVDEGKLAWELLERTSHASSRQLVMEVEAAAEAMLAEVAGDMEADPHAHTGLEGGDTNGEAEAEVEHGVEVGSHEMVHERPDTELAPVVEAEVAMRV